MLWFFIKLVPKNCWFPVENNVFSGWFRGPQCPEITISHHDAWFPVLSHESVCRVLYHLQSTKSPLTMRAWIKSQYSQTHDIFAYLWPKSIRWGAKKNWPMPIFRESAYHWPHFFGDSPLSGTKRNSAVHPDHTHYTPMYPIIFPLHPTTSNCISWYFNTSFKFILFFSHYIPITSQQIFSKHGELSISLFCVVKF